jgi:hypothetical protein
MIKVYHNEDFLNAMLNDQTPTAAKLELVAIVNTENFSEAYKLTNHIDQEWWKNDRVTVSQGEPNYRSTSVGDVLGFDDKFFMVTLFGFDELHDFDASDLPK